jgi:hypothetical protein
MNRVLGAPVSDPARSCGLTPTRRSGDRRSGRLMESSLFLLDLLTGHEPALAQERELSQPAALRQTTRLSRFSARGNIRAAVWDKPRSDYAVGVCRLMESSHGPKWPRIETMNRNEPGRRPALRFRERAGVVEVHRHSREP